MSKTMVYKTNSFAETQNVAQEFVQQLQGGDVVCLYGDLGAGKTTFVQGLARGLGIAQRIISPTFVMVRSYELRIKNYELRVKRFYHIDLYRIKGIEALEELGLDEILQDKEAVVVIEWPEKLRSLLSKKRWDIRFQYENENKRKIVIRKYEKSS